MLVPEADGGGSLSEHGLLDLVLVAEEMGRLVSPGPLVPVNVVASAVAAPGTAEQRAEVLPGLLAGEHGGGVVRARPRCRRRAGPTATASCSRARVAPVEAGAQAAAPAGDRRAPATGSPRSWCPPTRRASSVTPMGGLDLVRRFAEVRFDGVRRCRLDASSAPSAAAADAIERQLQIAVVLQCAETVGAVDRMFEITLEYLGDRYSFGRPLSSYQALKHRVADDKMWLEACHAIATGGRAGGRRRAPTTPPSW